MKEFAIVLIHGTHTTIILFDARADIDRYIADRTTELSECFMWYVVKVLERSQAEVAAGLDLIARMGDGLEDL